MEVRKDKRESINVGIITIYCLTSKICIYIYVEVQLEQEAC